MIHSNKLITAFSLLLLFGCGHSTLTNTEGPTTKVSQQGADNPLLGTWQVEAIQGEKVLASIPAHFIFSDNQSVSGSASCNNFTTRYALVNNHITISPTAITRKMCSPVIMTQENNFLTALANIKRYRFEKGTLYLLDKNNSAVFKASRKTEK
ncbi:MAG: META domain-containing protein [Colwellia sp.]|nr:META domain-containing protein [Colwellia sp.]MCW8866600.1 META domain-containing protein [Colwellia sp.]MCW9081772.1 META domain-containing protein [Colwellia sp.]